jgi:hypothetical protein
LGDHVIVAEQRDGFLEREQSFCVPVESFEPGEFVLELVGADRIAVRRVERPDTDYALVRRNDGLDVAGMIVRVVSTGQARGDVLHRAL